MRFDANISGLDVHSDMNLTVHEWNNYNTIDELEKLKKQLEDFKDSIMAICDELLYDVDNIIRIRAKEESENE